MTGQAFTIPGRIAPREPGQRRGLPDVWRPLAVATAALLALAVAWLALDHSATLQWKDALWLHDLTQWNSPSVESFGSSVLHLLDPLLFTIWGLAIVLVAVARGKPRLAVAIGAALVLAPLSAEGLKPLLSLPHDTADGTSIGSGSWPSGHSTAALVLILCAVLVAPPRFWRSAVALLGAVYVLAVGVFLVILAWHMPSDVIGGYLLATLWAALAVTAVRVSDRLWPPRRQRELDTDSGRKRAAVPSPEHV